MPLGWVDRCIYVPFSGGTGPFVTSTAVEGYLTPFQANAVSGTSYHYVAQLVDSSTGLPNEWEVGTGVYTSATQTLTRVTIEFNSDGTNTPHNFSAAPNVMITLLAQDVGLDVGVTPIVNGSVGNFLIDNTGILGEYTDAQAVAVLPVFTSSTSGVVPASGGGTTNFLRADGIFSSPPGGRTVLGTTTNYYVTTTGNDSTGNGSIGSPWLTLAHADTFIRNNLDIGGQTITVNIGTGSFAGISGGGGYTGSGAVNFIGISSATTTITSSFVFNRSTFTMLNFDAMKIAISSGTTVLQFASLMPVTIGTTAFDFAISITGAINVIIFLVQQAAIVTQLCNLAITLSGGPTIRYVSCTNSQSFFEDDSTSVFTGTATIQSGLVGSFHNSFVAFGGGGLSGGTLTGPRFFSDTGGLINTFGGGLNFFPGTTPGVVTSGGVYE